MLQLSLQQLIVRESTPPNDPCGFPTVESAM